MEKTEALQLAIEALDELTDRLKKEGWQPNAAKKTETAMLVLRDMLTKLEIEQEEKSKPIAPDAQDFCNEADYLAALAEYNKIK